MHCVRAWLCSFTDEHQALPFVKQAPCYILRAALSCLTSAEGLEYSGLNFGAEAGDSDKQIQKDLQDKCQNNQGHARIVNALLYGIIADRLRSQNLLRYLTLVVKDQFAYCCKQLQRLVLSPSSSIGFVLR
eukprot:3842758-Rhodomonas_salina.3